jgi:hypothetical protein
MLPMPHVQQMPKAFLNSILGKINHEQVVDMQGK